HGILAPGGDAAGLRSEIARLRATGERVVIGLPGANVAARELGCDRELVQKDSRWVVARAR
ncbi:MAG: hypothetical protein V3V64_10825, partial [Acidiferrobacterales bacterium]